MKRKFRRRLVYAAARILAAAFFLMPIRLAVFLGGWLGWLFFYLSPRLRHQALENLKSALGNEKSSQERAHIAKGVFENLGKNAAEFINFPKINKRNIDRFISVEGIEKIDRALESKTGIIALSCHLGNWELSAAYFGLKGYPTNAIVRPLRYEKYDRLVNSVRRSKNINIISREHSFKKIVSILKDNQVIGILPDQDIDSIDGVFVDFFGRKAYTATGPVLLAMASKAPIFMMFCIRQNARHRMIIEGPIDLEITGDKERDVLVNTQKWSALAEKYIRQYPEQWIWFHKRWKTQSQKSSS